MTGKIRFWRCKNCRRTLPRDAFSAPFLDANTRCDECLTSAGTTPQRVAQRAVQPVYVRSKGRKTPANHNRSDPR